MGSQQSTNVPIWITTGFLQKDRQNFQNMNYDYFCRIPVTCSQGVIVTEKYPDAGIFMNYDNDDYSQDHGQSEKAFRA